MTPRSLLSSSSAGLLAFALGCGGRADVMTSVPPGAEPPDGGAPSTEPTAPPEPEGGLVPAPLAGYRAGTLAAVTESGGGVSFFPTPISRVSPSFTLDFGPSQQDACSRIAFDKQRRLYVELYQAVPDEPPGRIEVFATGAYGSMAPLRVVTGPSLGNASNLTGLAVDTNDEIYVLRNDGNAPTSAVLVFGPDSDSVPVRTIMGENTGLTYPNGLAVDAAGQVYVGTDSSAAVLTFAAGADGNVAPIASLQATGMGGTEGIAVDATQRIYATVTSPPAVIVFHEGAVERTITGNATGLSSPIDVATDASGRIYVSDYEGTGTLRVFAPGASGNVAPEAVLPGIVGIGAAVAP